MCCAVYLLSDVSTVMRHITWSRVYWASCLSDFMCVKSFGQMSDFHAELTDVLSLACTYDHADVAV